MLKEVSVAIMVRYSENLLYFAIYDIYILEEFGGQGGMNVYTYLVFY